MKSPDYQNKFELTSVKGDTSFVKEGEEIAIVTQRSNRKFKMRELPSSCRNVLPKYIPILTWLPKYQRLDAVSDMIAGVTLALTMIPQSIAYAALAGLTAQYGLYSTIMGSFVYVAFGTIKEVSIGPSSLMALMTLQFTRDMPIEFVVLLAFLKGCIELIMGLLNLGFLVDFISVPVTSGFTSATSVIIIIAQLQGLFGLKVKTDGIVDSIVKLIQNVRDIRLGDTLIGLSSIVFLLLFRKLKDFTCCLPSDVKGPKAEKIKKAIWFLSISRNFIIVIITSLIAFALEMTYGTVPFILSGKVEPGLPSFRMIPLNAQVGNQTYSFVEMCSHLGSGIIIMPIVAVLANIAIAKTFSSGAPINATQEMLTLGICNIFGSFLQSMPTCGAFTRSAVSNSSGVRTPLASAYTGIITMLALSFLTPYFRYIPRATLAGVLISAVIFMIDLDIFSPLWKGSKRETITTVATFSISLIFTVEIGLMFGIMLNIFSLLYLWARPSIEVTKCKTIHEDEYLLLKPDIGLFYPAINFLRSKVLEAAVEEGRGELPLVLDCQRFNGIDYTAVKGIEALSKDFEHRNQQLMFLHVNPSIFGAIQSFSADTSLLYGKNEEDIVNALFGDKSEISRSATAPILKQIDDEVGYATRKDDEEEQSIQQQENESLLAKDKAANEQQIVTIEQPNMEKKTHISTDIYTIE